MILSWRKASLTANQELESPAVMTSLDRKSSRKLIEELATYQYRCLHPADIQLIIARREVFIILNLVRNSTAL